MAHSRLRALLDLAWPIVLARATQSVIGFSDALMVAPLGEAPLAATTTGALNTLAFIMLPMGTVFIVQSFAAQLRGRGDLASAARYAWYGLAIAAAAALIAIAALPFIEPLLALFAYEPEVRGLMTSYLAIRLLSVAPAVASEALGNWYGGLGNTRPALVASATAMLSNIAGNYALIEPRFGLPGWGVAGAAWASVAGSWLGLLVILLPFLRDPRNANRGRLELRELARVLRFGLPNGVNWFLEFFAFVLFINVVVGHLGTTVLAAMNVVLQINAISFMPAFGVASAGAIMVGEAIGRRAHEEVWPIVKLTGGVAAAWMVSAGVLYFVAPLPIMSLFRPRGVSADLLVDVGAGMLRIAALWQLFDALGLTLSEALRAAGDTAWCMAARIVLAWLVFTPAAWTAILVLGGGVGTVMASVTLYVAVLAAAFAARFASGRWREIELVDANVA
jgi:MATE family multidrug resistance protein